MRPIANLVETALVLLCTVWLISGQKCGNDTCFILSTDAAKTLFQSFEDVQLYGRCAARCVVEILGADFRRLVEINDYWRSIELYQLTKRRFYLMKQCTLGCTMSSLRTAECASTCLEMCEQCTEPYFNNGCDTRQCMMNMCRRGCQLSVEDAPPSLSTPSFSFETQPKTEAAGRFEVSASINSSLLTTDGSNSSESPPVSSEISAFIYKIVTENNTYYEFQWSLTEDLDLSFFSCEAVNVSLAVVNRDRSSPFTSHSTICVHGGPPSHPLKVTADSVVDDLRPGFYGYAVIGLTWLPPEGSHLLTGYELTMTPLSPRGYNGFCGDDPPNRIYTYLIEKNATTFEVRAETPAEVLRFGVDGNLGCSYSFVLESLPGRAKPQFPTPVNFNRGALVTSPIPPEINLGCSTIIDPITGLHTAELEFSYTNEPLIHQAIYSFHISLRDNNNSIDGRPIEANRQDLDEYGIVNGYFEQLSNVTIHFCEEAAPYSVELKNSDENITGVVRITGLCPQQDILFRIRPGINETEGPWWRPLPDLRDCRLSFSAQPPSTIPSSSITLLRGSVPLELLTEEDGTRVNLSLSWNPPSESYGTIERYDVYIGQRVLVGTEFSVTIPTGGNETTVDVEHLIPFNPRACLVTQIRSENNFEAVSNWSEPFYIPIEDGYSLQDCNTTEVTPPSEDDSTGLLAGVIVLSIVLFLVFILLIGVCLLCYLKPSCFCRRKSLMDREDGVKYWPTRYPPITNINNDWAIDGPDGNGWEIPKEYIVREYQLGEGAFGKVAKGFIRGPVPGTYTMKDRIHATVAMKFLKDSPSEQEKKDFSSEIELMKKIGFARHAHVVGLFGCVTVPQPTCILLEYLEYGDLLSYLQDINEEVNRVRLNNSEVSVPVVTLPVTSAYTNLGDIEPDNLLSFAFQIASGMEFLVGLEVIHRDLACRNILVGDKKTLKISDFGLSREGEVYVKMGGGRLPFKWMAIESLREREFTTQSDVWAYGVVLWEIATLGEYPYPTIANGDILDYISEGNRLEQPLNCSDEVYDVMGQCWEIQPEQRPSFRDLREGFESMLLETRNYLQFTPLSQDLTTVMDEEHGGQEKENISLTESENQSRRVNKRDIHETIVLSNDSAGAPEMASELEAQTETYTFM